MQPTLLTADMSYWRIAPDPRLRPYIACYWVMDGARSIFPGEELMIPDGHSEIVFTRLPGDFERWKLGERMSAQQMTRSYVIGGRSHTVGTRSESALQLAGVKLDARFLRHVIRTPLSEFRDGTLFFADLGHRPLLDLEDAVANARGPTEIAALFDRHLLAKLQDLPSARSSADALLQRIHQDRGATPIMSWARDAGVDARHLERSFCGDTGMTPKQYARVIRFKRAYRELLGGGRASPLIAQVDGFYDQSHFNREFRHFTGVAPGVRLAGRMTQGTLVADHLLEAG